MDADERGSHDGGQRVQKRQVCGCVLRRHAWFVVPPSGGLCTAPTLAPLGRIVPPVVLLTMLSAAAILAIDRDSHTCRAAPAGLFIRGERIVL